MEVYTVGAIPPMPAVGQSAAHRAFRLLPLPMSFTPDERRIVYPTPSAVVARCLPDALDFDTKLVETLTGNRSPLTACAVSPNGDLAVAADSKATVYVWINTARQLMGSGSSPASPGKDTSASPITYSLGLGYVHITGFEFSSDGKHMVVHGVDKYSKKLAAVIIPDAGNAVGSITGHTKGILAAHFRPTNDKTKIVVTAGADGRLCVHGGPPYKLRREIDVPNGKPLNCVQFSPDGKKLVTAGEDGCLRWWNWETGEQLHEAQVDSAALNAILWSPDSQRILLVNCQGRLAIVDGTDGRELDAAALVNCETAQPLAMRWGPQREWGVVALEDCSIQGFRTTGALSAFKTDESFIWRGIKGGSSCAVLNPLTEMLCVGDSTGCLLFMQMQDGEPQPLKALQHADSRATIRSVAVGTKVAGVISMDSKLRVIGIPATPQPFRRVLSKSKLELAEGAKAMEAAAAVGETGLKSRLSRQWTLGKRPEEEEWRVVGQAEFKDAPVEAVKIAEDKALLVMCSNGIVRCFPFEDTAVGDFDELWQVRLEGTILHATVTVDGSLVAVLLEPHADYPMEKLGDEHEDKPIPKSVLEFYEMDGFTKPEHFRLACAYELSPLEVTAIAMSPAGTHIAWADYNKALSVMEVETGKIIVKNDWRMHQTRLTTLCWSPDGTKLASGSHDKNIIIFDITYQGRYIMIDDCHQGGTTSVQFLLNNLVMSTGVDGTLSMNEFSFGPPPADVEPYVYEEDGGGSVEE